jgi:DNA-binding NarL/FixJ family response regulator
MAVVKDPKGEAYMDSIRVLLVEDHTIVRKGLRALLEGESDIEVVGEAEDGRQALDQVQQLLPDVVLMDLGMPGLNGLEATRQIKRQFPKIRVVVLTMHTDEESVFQVLQVGASGYLIKQARTEEVLAAIRAVYRGESFLSPSISTKVIEEYLRRAGKEEPVDPYERLTNREREVLQLIAEGHSTQDIANLLYISAKTVETHRARLMEKLDIHTIAELTQYAIRKGVIKLE